MKYIIGLDMGITSVGFATMLLDEKDEPCRILRMGSRIFCVSRSWNRSCTEFEPHHCRPQNRTCAAHLTAVFVGAKPQKRKTSLSIKFGSEAHPKPNGLRVGFTRICK